MKTFLVLNSSVWELECLIIMYYSEIGDIKYDVCYYKWHLSTVVQMQLIKEGPDVDFPRYSAILDLELQLSSTRKSRYFKGAHGRFPSFQRGKEGERWEVLR